MRAVEKMSGRPTSRSRRATETYCGIAYGARALRRRSARSSRRGPSAVADGGMRRWPQTRRYPVPASSVSCKICGRTVARLLNGAFGIPRGRRRSRHAGGSMRDVSLWHYTRIWCLRPLTGSCGLIQPVMLPPGGSPGQSEYAALAGRGRGGVPSHRDHESKLLAASCLL